MTAFPTFGQLESGVSGPISITVALPAGSPMPDLNSKLTSSHAINIFCDTLETRCSDFFISCFFFLKK